MPRIAADRLAHLLLCRRDIQHIVHDLERQPDAVGISGGDPHLPAVRRSARRQHAELCRRADQRAGLACLQEQQFLARQGVLLTEHIHDLPAHHAAAPGGIRQHADRRDPHLRRKPAGTRQHPEGIQCQSVACQQCRRLAEHAVVGRASAPQRVIVHAGQVIMDEREGMHHLNRRRERQRRRSIPAEQAAEFQRQRRTHPLPPGKQGVAHSLVQSSVTATVLSALIQPVQESIHLCRILFQYGAGKRGGIRRAYLPLCLSVVHTVTPPRPPHPAPKNPPGGCPPRRCAAGF